MKKVTAKIFILSYKIVLKCSSAITITPPETGRVHADDGMLLMLVGTVTHGCYLRKIVVMNGNVNQC